MFNFLDIALKNVLQKWVYFSAVLPWSLLSSPTQLVGLPINIFGISNYMRIIILKMQNLANNHFFQIFFNNSIARILKKTSYFSGYFDSNNSSIPYVENRKKIRD